MSPLNTNVPLVPDTIPFQASLLSRTSLPPVKSTVAPSAILTLTSEEMLLPVINDKVLDRTFKLPASAFNTPVLAEPV